ncbi:hypothetical protein GTQ40_01085 [Flavobacteriaceae bacterium R38]|nr:hypothetical protein [Flavobacteriaceae bacterium R38]
MRFSKIEILLNILFWVFFTWLFVFNNTTMDVVSFEIIDGKKQKVLERNYVKLYTFMTLQVLSILFIYIELYFIHRLKKPKAVRNFILKSIFLFFVTFTIQTITVFLFYTYYNRLDELKDANSFNAYAIMNIFYIAVAICYGFTKKWIQHEREKQQLELVKNQAELNLLRQQLQPHFLFNTMNNLMAMVNQSDNPKLAQSIDKLSGLLRYVVYDTQQYQKVTIAREIEFIRNFAELHLLRFEEDEIDFKLNVTGDHDSQTLEPGIFLCYVENAFKHGVQPEEKAFIHINIDISKENFIHFEIENSIQKNPLQREEGGFGVKANKERLDLIYPDQYSLTTEIQYSLTTKESETYKVQLKIMSK